VRRLEGLDITDDDNAGWGILHRCCTVYSLSGAVPRSCSHCALVTDQRGANAVRFILVHRYIRTYSSTISLDLTESPAYRSVASTKCARLLCRTACLIPGTSLVSIPIQQHACWQASLVSKEANR